MVSGGKLFRENFYKQQKKKNLKCNFSVTNQAEHYAAKFKM